MMSSPFFLVPNSPPPSSPLWALFQLPDSSVTSSSSSHASDCLGAPAEGPSEEGGADENEASENDGSVCASAGRALALSARGERHQQTVET